MLIWFDFLLFRISSLFALFFLTIGIIFEKNSTWHHSPKIKRHIPKFIQLIFIYVKNKKKDLSDAL
jgi:hypothetical protein